MKFYTAKLLQLIGLIVVLTGFLYGWKYNLIRFELGALAIGSLLFYGGWLMERKVA